MYELNARVQRPQATWTLVKANVNKYKRRVGHALSAETHCTAICESQCAVVYETPGSAAVGRGAVGGEEALTCKL